MEIRKYQAHQILYIIRHNMRDLPDGKYGNESIVPELRGKNTELISRGKTPKEVNQYRKELEKEIFQYKRKNLIHAVNVIIQCPDDCPPEEETRFFQTCYQFWKNRLPMGERCIIQAAIHRDEIVKAADGRRISHNHMHLSFVPAVPDTKHEGYKYKLSAYVLTKKTVLKTLHPDLQKYLDEAGVHATVFKKNKDGHTLSLSVAALKEITKLTGISLSDSITVENLADLINKSIKNEQIINKLQDELSLKSSTLNSLAVENTALQKELSDLKKQLSIVPKTHKRTFSWDKPMDIKNQEVTQ